MLVALDPANQAQYLQIVRQGVKNLAWSYSTSHFINIRVDHPDG